MNIQHLEEKKGLGVNLGSITKITLWITLMGNELLYPRVKFVIK
jgi:hypothetical protein